VSSITSLSKTPTNVFAKDVANQNSRTNNEERGKERSKWAGYRLHRGVYVDSAPKLSAYMNLKDKKGNPLTQEQFEKRFKAVGGTSPQECFMIQTLLFNDLISKFPSVNGRYILCALPEEFKLMSERGLLDKYRTKNQIIDSSSKVFMFSIQSPKYILPSLNSLII
jgi:hypothetical protein